MSVRSRSFTLLCCAILALALALALLSTPASAIPENDGEQAKAKIGMFTARDSEGNGVYIWLQAFVEALEDNSDLQFAFYPNGSLGGDRERMDQLALGLLEINSTNPDELSRLSPTYYTMAPPFLFNSYAHMDRFLEQTPFLATVNRELAPHGIVLLDLAYTGAMVGLLTREIPIMSIGDLSKIRLRFLSRPDLEMLKAWNVRGVQVAWSEVAQALQTGMVDGYLNPPSVATLYGHGSVLDYFTDLRMGPSARMIVASRDWLDSLTPRQHDAVNRAISIARARNRAWNLGYIDQEKARLEQAGIEWLTPTPAARDEWARHRIDYSGVDWYDAAAEAQVHKWLEATRTGQANER
ncbi:MAG TPA: hypothetical protein DD459_00955 [Halieaceae bacterium]|nr:hypothetical protein [Halieaceae bacterium]|tara:strand:+ start:10419 stop:11477 length:1059 start_codon:yes stop_codon:yes gene_type:complete